jgi:hypothetical protein
VEAINQRAAGGEEIDGAGDATQCVARGVDRQQRRMLPCGDGTARFSVSIKRGAAVAAQALLDERGMSLLLSAPRRQAHLVATYPRSLESGPR